jgi:hypothetical protein
LSGVFIRWNDISSSRRGVNPAGIVASEAYTRGMSGVVLLLVLGVGVGALILWGIGLPPTRPRPDSRYRGRTYMSVHRKLKSRKPPD